MAKKQVPLQNTFAKTILKIGYRFSLSKVFDDFLTMAIACCSINPLTKLSNYEDEYLETISYYKDSELRFEFSNAHASLIVEMEERLGSSLGNDILGEFFEQHISNSRNGQFFTPYPICEFMASVIHTDVVVDGDYGKPLRILDPSCGSGRMLMASYKRNKNMHEYYWIDIDRICVKMTALNLFLNGIWDSEVMCANALSPDDFVCSYRISFLPFGIFKITEKEKSKLWWMHKNSFPIRVKKEPLSSGIILDETPFSERTKDNSTQLDLF
jgi:type I restriction-modification system DNA methylase subunit